MMEELALEAARVSSTVIDMVMMIVVVAGTAVTVIRLILGLLRGQHLPANIRAIWLSYAAWILLALEFALASDLLSTVARPSWQQIGQLGAIAAVRIALGYFLGRDINDYSKGEILPNRASVSSPTSRV